MSEREKEGLINRPLTPHIMQEEINHDQLQDCFNNIASVLSELPTVENIFKK
jgi:hypothetical protein